ERAAANRRLPPEPAEHQHRQAQRVDDGRRLPHRPTLHAIALTAPGSSRYTFASPLTTVSYSYEETDRPCRARSLSVHSTVHCTGPGRPGARLLRRHRHWRVHLDRVAD